MKRLVLKKLIIISQKDEEAKIVDFDDKLTVITSDDFTDNVENRTGKSLIMKSIYYSFGAKLKKYTSNWNYLKICTIVNFDYDNNKYELYRENNSFILKKDTEQKFFENISDLRKYYAEFFNFKIKMPVSKFESTAIYAYPGAIFMPFYMDQDVGWSGSWNSFNDIFGGKWKKEILLYHLGIRTPEYYKLSGEKIELNNKQKANKEQANILEIILKNQVEKHKKYLDINVDLNKFADEIAELTNELNEQMDKRNCIKTKIVECFNEIREAEELYRVAEKVYMDLSDDVNYVETNVLEDTITCPICGTVHENSIENHFNIYSEIQQCEDTMQKYFNDREKIEEKIRKQLNDLDMLENYINEIDDILKRKREKVTFKEVILSEGSKSMVSEVKSDINKLKREITVVEESLNKITKKQAALTKKGKSISDLYLQQLKDNLDELNVKDIDENDIKKIKTSFNSGGNDLPCTIIAQVYALYSISIKNSKTVNAPIVLDAIFQQEPAKKKINEIWNFIINSQPVQSQLIISTTEMHNKKIDGKIITLTKVQGLLNKDDYNKVSDKFNYYKRNILAYKKEKNNE